MQLARAIHRTHGTRAVVVVLNRKVRACVCVLMSAAPLMPERKRVCLYSETHVRALTHYLHKHTQQGDKHVYTCFQAQHWERQPLESECWREF